MANSLPVSSSQALRAAPVPLETLALRTGQLVEARVVGAGQGGATQLAIGNQLVEAALSVRIQTGVLIQLLVQGTGPNIRLTVLPPPQGQPPQAQAAQGVPRGQAVQAPPPLPGNPPPAGPPHGQTQGSAAQSRPVAASTQLPSQLPGQSPSQSATLPQARAQTLPGTTSQSAPQPPPPTIVTAGKTAPGQGTAPQGGQLPPAAGVQGGAAAGLEPGTILRFQVQGSGANARPVLVPVATPGRAGQASQGSSPTQPAASALVPSPLAQALAQTVQNAVARQDSITTLLTSLAGLGAKLSELPKPVEQAGARLLASQLNLSAKPLDGAGLKQAILRSGILFENTLAKGGAQALPQGDLKGALLNLRNALRTWLGGGVQPAGQNGQRPPPPTSGAHPRAAQPANPPTIPVLPNAEVGARLLGQAEAALARLQLTQISSLPEVAGRPGQGPVSDLNFELPLLLGGEMNIGQFQITRDGGGKDGKDRDGEWKMRFSINFSQTGEVGATVSLRGGKTGVMLWAEREETAGALQEKQGELADSLSARGLEPGSIRCRHGHPPQAKKPVGAFMDNSS